jgi:hypothetical protein
MPYFELRSKFGIEGKAPDQITESVQAVYAKGQLPKRDEVSFKYMWSADQNLGTGIGHGHPHMNATPRDFGEGGEGAWCDFSSIHRHPCGHGVMGNDDGAGGE